MSGNMHTDSTRPRYTEAQAAMELTIPEETLRWARYRKRIAYCKMGKEVRYSQKHLDDYTMANEHNNGDVCGEDISSGKEQEAHSGILPGPWDGSRFAEAQAQKILNSLNRS